MDWINHIRELTPSDVGRRGRTLHELDFDNLTFDEIVAKTKSAFPWLPVLFTRVEPGTLLYRARNNEKSEPWRTVQDISAPLKEKVKKVGRANRPFQRVFYAAFNCDTVLLEVSPEYGKVDTDYHGSVTLGTWEVTRPLTVATIWATDVAVEKRHDLQTLAERFYRSLIATCRGEDIPEKSFGVVICLQSHLGYVFAHVPQSESYYKLSAAYSARISAANPDAHGLRYPSVAGAYDDDNIALYESVIETGLRLVQAQHVEYKIQGGRATVYADTVGKADICGDELRWD